MAWFRVPIWREVESFAIVEADNIDEAEERILDNDWDEVVDNPEGDEVISEVYIAKIEEFEYQQNLPLMYTVGEKDPKVINKVGG